MMLSLDLLRQNKSLDGEALEAVGELRGGAQRAGNLTRQLLMFSRRSVLDVKTLELNAVVSNLLKMLGRLVGEHIKLQFQIGPSLPLVEADTTMLEQVLMNLVLNARDALPGGGRITITTRAVEFDPARVRDHPDRRPGRFARLSVADAGCGMDEETLKRIFEPFFTTKGLGKGSGLGLATVYGVVAQHQGWVEVESQVGQGSVFHVFLPASTKSGVPAEAGGRHDNLRGSGTILVVEDELAVRTILARTLCRFGYTVLEAGGGREAMELWKARRAEIDLLLTDMVMPGGMTGLSLAEKLRSEKPSLKVIVTSGYSGDLFEHGGNGCRGPGTDCAGGRSGDGG